MSFLRKQESILADGTLPGAMNSCFCRNDGLRGRVGAKNLIIEL
ncbi:Uncharacterized protein dnm_058900 [Desulfonema magnum]|uniref:Uncharacterized protein n=1 Tax=Desulfonema magnum TaxID=45655 RepID=A0A975GRA2_9BACT|nr:Uncharacterized protein dnm_058900 [Desulfonema magnum]